jgi:hypothetical protein
MNVNELMHECEWMRITEMNAPDCLHPPAIVWEYSLTGAYQLDEAMYVATADKIPSSTIDKL